MNLYLSIALCFLPLILSFVLFKIFSKIKVSTELSASILGIAAVLPITALQFLLNFLFSKSKIFDTQIIFIFLKTLVYNGLLEEGVKFLLLLIIPSKKNTFTSFFIASILFGVALGSFESVIYFLNRLQLSHQNNGQLLYGMIFLRMFTAILIHAFCASLCGIFVWSIKEKQSDVFAFIFAILAHGLYDFFSSFTSWIQYFAVAAILLAILECRIHYEKNKPVTEYKKDSVPAKESSDVTIETALKDAPVYND